MFRKVTTDLTPLEPPLRNIADGLNSAWRHVQKSFDGIGAIAHQFTVLFKFS